MTSPDEELARAVRRYRRAKTAMDRAREDLASAIVAARNAGARPSAIARKTGLTPERIRQIIAEAEARESNTPSA